MKKLEVKHIAPYLAYGLELKFVSKYEVDRLSEKDIVTLKTIDEGYICVNGYRTNNISYLPILRPLSQLTQEIEHNGEKFVPIVELLKIKHKGWYIEKQGIRYCEIDFELTNNYSKAWFKFHAIHSIDVWLRNLENEQYWVIEKLFEWHFDVFGLIEQNLAIEKL